MSCVTIYIMYQDSAGYTVCPESLVTYYIKWVKPSWTDSTLILNVDIWSGPYDRATAYRRRRLAGIRTELTEVWSLTEALMEQQGYIYHIYDTTMDKS